MSGAVTAPAIAATVSDAGQFKSGRHFAAWPGLVPQQHSSGDEVRTGGIEAGRSASPATSDIRQMLRMRFSDPP